MSFHDECGVIGVYGAKNAASLSASRFFCACSLTETLVALYNYYKYERDEHHDEPYDGGVPGGGFFRRGYRQPLQDTRGRRIALGTRRASASRLD